MRTDRKWRELFAVGLALTALVTVAIGCKSDSGGSGGGSVAGVKGFASGVITARGSIFVNGIEYDTSSSSITVDNTTGTDTDLAVGMTVDIKGHIDTATGLGVADEIDYASSIDGTVDSSSLNASAGTFSVFGQSIITDLATVVEGSTGFSGTTPLAEGDRVEISGTAKGSDILASRIEVKTGSSEDFKLRGTVGNLSAGSFDLTLEGGSVIAVTYTGTLSTAIANGSEVKLEASLAPSSGAISTSAGKIELKHELSIDEGDRVEVNGIVSNLVSSGAPVTFTIEGIDISAAASLAAGIADGNEVEVKGEMVSGILVAEEISADHEADLEFQGVLSAVDLAAGTLKLNGVTIHADINTIFVDDTEIPVDFFGLDDLATGDNAEIKAFYDGTDIIAVKLERHDSGDTEAQLSGVVTAIGPTAGAITVYDLEIDLYSVFSSASEADSFISSLEVGSPVKLVGTISGSTVTWTAIELNL